MKATGIVRKIDDLGRLVLPIELRRTMDVSIKDSLEIFVDGDQIVLKKYEPACAFCGNAKDVVSYKRKNICQHCIDELRQIEGALELDSASTAHSSYQNSR